MSAEPIDARWKSFLDEIDMALPEAVAFYCFGGFALQYGYGMSRTTEDLDILAALPNIHRKLLTDGAGEFSPLHRKYKLYLDFVTVSPTIYNHEDRLRPLFPGKWQHIELYVLDPYDIALSKILRNEPFDRADVMHLARTIPFDLSVLKHRYKEEVRPYLGIPEREDHTLQLWLDMIEEERHQE